MIFVIVVPGDKYLVTPLSQWARDRTQPGWGPCETLSITTILPNTHLVIIGYLAGPLLGAIKMTVFTKCQIVGGFWPGSEFTELLQWKRVFSGVYSSGLKWKNDNPGILVIEPILGCQSPKSPDLGFFRVNSGSDTLVKTHTIPKSALKCKLVILASWGYNTYRDIGISPSTPN